jgi:hypothetical protein
MLEGQIKTPENQLSFYKILKTQIQQISSALSCPSNGIPSRDSDQESVKYITTLFEGKAPEFLKNL